jgi:primosomal protein N' (replication factor Y) (superfamily II helicase)
VTTPERYAEVGIPVPLGQSFSYRIPAGMRVAPGARVLCPFGPRKLLGIALAVHDEPPAVAADKLKDLLAVIDPEPVLPPELLDFCRQLSSYYFAPIGEVLRLAVPAVERARVRALEAQGQLLPSEAPTRQVGGREVLFARATEVVEAPGSLRGQAAAILALLRAGGDAQVSALAKRYGNARPALDKLAAFGLVALERRPLARVPLFDDEPARDAAPTLTGPQEESVARIAQALGGGDERAFLLWGVTGSGKTEVYMHAIAACLEKARGALVLVPEIALTPQLVGRFRARFGDEVAVLHSALAEADRHLMWRKLREGRLRLAVGARSALFAPVADLGLVVVDEEHDASFKQEEGVRYHARDMALLRAHRAGAIAVLGSATPSLESVALARRGKIVELRLPERATRAAMPEVEIVDLRRHKNTPSGHRMLTAPLHRAVDGALAAGEQAIVFLNRRGFAPAVVCDGCGTVASCHRCSVALTYHRRAGGRLRCHYCDYAAPLPSRCPACNEAELVLEGLGTEKLESAIAEAFPSARVARLDRDVAAGAKSARVLDRMRRGEIDILVGTQMVTKGHDLPNVTVVGVVNADAALSMPDFRAAERGFSLLVQVAGRAGRHERPGRVIIQTRDPEHAAIRFAARHDVAGFLAHELRDRQEVGYPPFRRLALVRIDAVEEDRAREVAARFAAQARSHPEAARGAIEILGPAPAPIARLRNRYRFRVLLRAMNRGALRGVMKSLVAIRDERDRKVRVALDVDPVSML